MIFFVLWFIMWHRLTVTQIFPYSFPLVRSSVHIKTNTGFHFSPITGKETFEFELFKWILFIPLHHKMWILLQCSNKTTISQQTVLTKGSHQWLHIMWVQSHQLDWRWSSTCLSHRSVWRYKPWGWKSGLLLLEMTPIVSQLGGFRHHLSAPPDNCSTV